MRILILSAGGSKGAYQAGVVKYLSTKYRWDIIAGNSVGAVNASFLSQFDKDMQWKGGNDLYKLWKNIKGKGDIYSDYWIFSYIVARYKGGLYSQKPLRKLLERNVDFDKVAKSNVDLYVGAVSSTTEEMRIVSNEEEDLLKWVLASAAIPILLRPVGIDGDLWLDGGLRDMIFDISKIGAKVTAVDIVLGQNLNHKVAHKSKDMLDIIERTVDIATKEIIINDLTSIVMNSNVKELNLYEPSVPLDVESLDFDPKQIARMLKLGYDDAKRIYNERLK